jgi:hypothetical protein
MQLSWFAVAACAAGGLRHASACDTQAEVDFDSRPPYSSHSGMGSMFVDAPTASAPLTLLPQDAGTESPACLDGSPYGFYLVRSTTNSTKWTISIEGGGWCYDEQSCLQRANTTLGSSKHWSPTSGCGCMNTEGDGLDEDCNCLYMPYCDGECGL